MMRHYAFLFRRPNVLLDFLANFERRYVLLKDWSWSFRCIIIDARSGTVEGPAKSVFISTDPKQGIGHMPISNDDVAWSRYQTRIANQMFTPQYLYWASSVQRTSNKLWLWAQPLQTLFSNYIIRKLVVIRDRNDMSPSSSASQVLQMIHAVLRERGVSQQTVILEDVGDVQESDHWH